MPKVKKDTGAAPEVPGDQKERKRKSRAKPKSGADQKPTEAKEKKKPKEKLKPKKESKPRVSRPRVRKAKPTTGPLLTIARCQTWEELHAKHEDICPVRKPIGAEEFWIHVNCTETEFTSTKAKNAAWDALPFSEKERYGCAGARDYGRYHAEMGIWYKGWLKEKYPDWKWLHFD